MIMSLIGLLGGTIYLIMGITRFNSENISEKDTGRFIILLSIIFIIISLFLIYINSDLNRETESKFQVEQSSTIEYKGN